MPISVYAPILQSTQVAFPYEEITSYGIKFTSQFTDIEWIREHGHVQIRIVDQVSNKSVVSTKYLDGNIYKPGSEIFLTSSKEKIYTVFINNEDLNQGDPSNPKTKLAWNAGQLYKIQMRFGSTEMYSSNESFAEWKQQQVDNQTFSEWSTVMIVKPVSTLQPKILNATDVHVDVIQSEQIEPTLTPLYTGTVDNLSQWIALNNETIKRYKFVLSDDDGEVIDKSEWLPHTSSEDTWRSQFRLSDQKYYSVVYYLQTKNGYEATSTPYRFKAAESYLSALKNMELIIDSEDPFCKENGCINIKLSTATPYTGCIVLSRASEDTNFLVQEDLRYFTFSSALLDEQLIYQDYTIESGIRYKYFIQQENSVGLRTSPLTDRDNGTYYVDFEYSYLFHNGIQLCLMFNQKLSSFKHTTLTSKQDTLGGKYPHLTRNGYAYYAEFPISGTISIQMDSDNTFLQLEDKGYFYDDTLVIPEDKFNESDSIRDACREEPHLYDPNWSLVPEDEEDKEWIQEKEKYPTKEKLDQGGRRIFRTIAEDGITPMNNRLDINSNLTGDNVFVERKFREKVEEFLNNFDYKLYKSPTEGNIVVILHNVSLTPNATLGRMIFDFSATAYEVMESTIENLNNSGIIEIGTYQRRIKEQAKTIQFGQISGIYTSEDVREVNIYELIKQKEELEFDNGDKLYVQKIRTFWIERYPTVSFENEVNELTNLLNETTDEKEKEDINNQIKKLEDLDKAIQNNPVSNIVVLSVGGKKIVVAADKIYSVKQPFPNEDEEWDFKLLYSPYPIIINYTCDLLQDNNPEYGEESAIDSSRIWGQASGIFSGTDQILRQYKYEYNLGVPPWRIYNNPILIDDRVGHVIIDSTNYNVWKTINICDIVEEEVRHQVEYIYGQTFSFVDGEWRNYNDTLRYTFERIESIDIEADPGTILEIWVKGKKQDIIIGPTGRYVISPNITGIDFVAFKTPQYALVNYKCITTQRAIQKLALEGEEK